MTTRKKIIENEQCYLVPKSLVKEVLTDIIKQEVNARLETLSDEINTEIADILKNIQEVNQMVRNKMKGHPSFTPHANQPYAQHILKEYLDKEHMGHLSCEKHIQDFLNWLERKYQINRK